MKLEGKKELAARTLNVGKKRIIFNVERLSEIKEAITKQDIKDLKESGAIIVAEKKGRRTIQRRTTRRRAGSIKKKVKGGKREYIIQTRKLRSYLATMKKRNQVTKEQYNKIRKEIKARHFRSLSNMKERLALINTEVKHNAKNTKKTQERRKN